MPATIETSTVEKDKHMKSLKRKLEPWRELVLLANTVLVHYPNVILAVTTSIFLIFWLLEPAFLTWVSVMLFSAALIDYCAPILTSNFLSNNWTGVKEKNFEEICQKLSCTILRFQSLWNSVLNSRTNRPLVYYTTVHLGLLFLAWIGHVVDNLLLIYLFVNIVLLSPAWKQCAQQVICAVRSKMA